MVGRNVFVVLFATGLVDQSVIRELDVVHEHLRVLINHLAIFHVKRTLALIDSLDFFKTGFFRHAKRLV